MKKIAYLFALPLVISMGVIFTGFTSGNDKRVDVKIADSSFLTTASQANLAEIDAGKLAVSMSMNEAVKRIGQMMVTDHSVAQNELIALAKSLRVILPLEPDAGHKSTIDQLSRLSGTAFDSAYLKSQLMDHQVAITLFEQESRDGSNDSVRAYAAKYLPKLKDHLKMIKMGSSTHGDEKMGM